MKAIRVLIGDFLLKVNPESVKGFREHTHTFQLILGENHLVKSLQRHTETAADQPTKLDECPEKELEAYESTARTLSCSRTEG